MTEVIKLDVQHILAMIAKPKVGTTYAYYSSTKDIDIYIPFSSYQALIQELTWMGQDGITNINLEVYKAAINHYLNNNRSNLISLYYKELALIMMSEIYKSKTDGNAGRIRVFPDMSVDGVEVVELSYDNIERYVKTNNWSRQLGDYIRLFDIYYSKFTEDPISIDISRNGKLKGMYYLSLLYLILHEAKSEIFIKMKEE